MKPLRALILCMALGSFTAGPAAAQSIPGSTPGAVGLPNPASSFCVQCGGTVVIDAAPQGQTGWCILPGGLMIEEWALWRLFNPQTAQTR